MGNFLANTPLGTALKTFVAVLLAGVIGSWSTDGAISFDKWQTWVIAALVSALPVITNWLNPSFTAYGVQKASDGHAGE
jgi:ABC-type molybdate transport system permease subunit